MKLELKHLAPYLPYGLQMKLNSRVVWRPNHKEKATLKGADATLTTALLDDIQEKVYDSLGKFQPILRPLSELNREEISLTLDEHYHLDRIKLGDTQHYGSLCYVTIIYLAKNHFDFQNLIKKGLAIDINSLKS